MAEEASYRWVPWYSMEEWKLVYQQVYSSDLQQMKHAYRRMLIWKAKAESLPAGVECTLGILQVRLREMELTQNSVSVLSQEDLQLMYSTAVIRFLNMIADLEKERTSLFHKANEMQIPSWIVNLRHDAAHSTSLPSLHSMKQAAEFILNWLDKFYWKKEEENMFDYFIQRSSCNIHKRRTIKLIQNLLFAYLDIATSNEQCVSEKVMLQLKPYVTHIDKDSKKAKTQLLTKLAKDLPKERDKQQILYVILEKTDFLDVPENQAEIIHFKNVWGPILTILNKFEILIDLMRELVEIVESNQANARAAAIWIDEITRSYSKLSKCLELKCVIVKKFTEPIDKKVMFQSVQKLVNEKYSKLRPAIMLKGGVPLLHEFKDILEQALRNPNQWTFKFIDSLCFLCSVPKPAIIELLKIYTNNMDDNGLSSNQPNITKVCTLSSILQSNNMVLVEQFTDNNCQDSDNIWRVAEEVDWLHHPCGTVLNQEDCPYLDFNILEDDEVPVVKS